MFNLLSWFKSLSTLVSLLFLTMAVLAGCTTANQQALGVGVEPVSKPKTTSAEEGTDQQTALAPVSSPQSPAENAAAVVASTENASKQGSPGTKIGFLPITGATKSAVSSLSKALGEASRQQNIAIVSSVDQSAGYRLKGYMSALNEGSRTTVTFYWDVLDRYGKRLYRINGFEQESGANSNPWANVSTGTMRRIAGRTINGLSQWLKRKGA